MRLHLRVVSKALFAALLIAACLLLLGNQGILNYGRRAMPVTSQVTTDTVNEKKLDPPIIPLQTRTQDLCADPVKVNSSAEVKLVLLTYMRSGSSFTGDLFNHHPEVFYVFEPLWSIQKDFETEQPVFFFNKSWASPVKANMYNPRSLTVETIQSFLDCRLGDVDVKTLTQYHLMNSRTTAGFYSCKGQHKGVLGLLVCLPSLQEICNAARVTSVKTIRFNMKQAATLLQRDPKVKVIHLLRDPRGTLRSQASVSEFQWSAVGTFSRTFCERVQTDLEEAEKLKKLYPGRVLSARYEDLAIEPLKFAEKLLTFVGLPFKRPLQEYVWNITSAGLKDGNAVSTQRNNSRRTAVSWRQKLNFKDVIAIDRNCKEVYKRVGYLPFNREEAVKMLSIPSFVNYTSVPALWT